MYHVIAITIFAFMFFSPSTTKEKKTPFELHGVNMNRSEPNLPCRAVSVYGHTLCQTTVRASNICIKVCVYYKLVMVSRCGVCVHVNIFSSESTRPRDMLLILKDTLTIKDDKL